MLSQLIEERFYGDQTKFYQQKFVKTPKKLMYMQSMHNSNFPCDSAFSSSKKKATTPALLFFKSQKDSTSKVLTQNNSGILNTNRSPLRSSNAKNISLMSRSPMLNKSGISCSQNKSNQSLIFSKSRRMDQMCQDTLMRESVHYCQNHEQRGATFMSCTQDGEFNYFCEKCAILIASQGYTVQKISDSSSSFGSNKMQASRKNLKSSMISQKSSRSVLLSNSRSIYESRNNRQVQIEGFLQMTKGLLQQIEYKKQEIKENLIRSEQFYGEQIEEVNEYFELVYKSLQLEKNKCYNYILNQRIEVEKPVRMINQTITDLKGKIQGIIEDIEENIETVFQTADEIYRPVIEQYEQNYQDISKKIAQIQVLEVEMRKIDFQGVPDSIFSISDILKESIEQSYQSEHQNNLNNQLNSLKQSLRESLPQLHPKKLFSKRAEPFENTDQNSSNKFCFSFEGEALQAQLEMERGNYQSQESLKE